MKIINKLEPSERIITAEFTQSEWNELASSFGNSCENERERHMQEMGLTPKASDGINLYNFLMDQVR